MFKYDDIGKKIKNLAKAIFIFEAISSIIVGLYFLFSDIFIFGFVVIFLGPVVAYILSWLTYGFGELITNSEIIAQALSKDTQIQSDLHSENISQSTAPHASLKNSWRCPHCETINPLGQHKCKNCGK